MVLCYLVRNMFFRKNNLAFSWLIVGLGNPGLQYEATRHNVGFMAADGLAREYGCDFSRRKFDAVFGEAVISGERVLIAKPQTFMNLSGKAVEQIASFYKIPYNRVVIIFDDISLDVGKIRVRRKGSHGGHNGMKDIIELCGTDDIPRIKIGVGAKPHPDYDLKDWVLGKFPAEQKETLGTALGRAGDAVKEIIKHGIDSAMNKYNG